MIKTLFFDLDDTLYLFENSPVRLAAEISAIKLLCSRFNKELSKVYPDFIDFLGKLQKSTESAIKYDRSFWFREYLKKLGLEDNGLSRELEKEYWSVFPELIKPYEDLAIILPELSKGYDLYVLSDGIRKNQLLRLRLLGFDKYFRLLCADDYKSLKPSREVFEYALDFAKTSKEEALMVGDKPHKDIRGANDAGITSVWIKRGKYAAITPKGKDAPDYSIRNYFEFLNILENFRD